MTVLDEPTRAKPVVGGTALVLVSACCFGTIAILTILARRAGAPLSSILAGRYVVASIVLAGLLVLARNGARVPRDRALKLVLLAGPAQAAIAWLTLASLEYISAATLVFLFYTYPAWVALVSATRGVERLDRRRVVALLLSLLGIVVMVGGPGSVAIHPKGAGLALGGAIVYGLFIPFVGRLQEGIAPIPVAMCVSIGAGVVFAIAGAATGTLTLRLAPMAWVVIAVLAIVCTVIAFQLFLSGLALLGPVRTAIVSTVEPFWTSLLGALILAQPVGIPTLLGGTCIAAAVVLLQRAAPSPDSLPRSGGRERD